MMADQQLTARVADSARQALLAGASGLGLAPDGKPGVAAVIRAGVESLFPDSICKVSGCSPAPDIRKEALQEHHAAVLAALRESPGRVFAETARWAAETALTAIGRGPTLVDRVRRVEILDTLRTVSLSPGQVAQVRAVKMAIVEAFEKGELGVSQSIARNPELDRITQKMNPGVNLKAMPVLSPEQIFVERIEAGVPIGLHFRKSPPNCLGQTGLDSFAFTMTGPEDDPAGLVSTSFFQRGLQAGLTQILLRGFARPERWSEVAEIIAHTHPKHAAALRGLTDPATGKLKEDVSKALAALVPQGAAMEDVDRGYALFWGSIDASHEARHQFEGERYARAALMKRPHHWNDAHELFDAEGKPNEKCVDALKSYYLDETMGWRDNYLMMAKRSEEIIASADFLHGLLERPSGDAADPLAPIRALFDEHGPMSSIDKDYVNFYVKWDGEASALFQSAFDAGWDLNGEFFNLFPRDPEEGLDGRTDDQKRAARALRKFFADGWVTAKFLNPAVFMESLYILTKETGNTPQTARAVRDIVRVLTDTDVNKSWTKNYSFMSEEPTRSADMAIKWVKAWIQAHGLTAANAGRSGEYDTAITQHEVDSMLTSSKIASLRRS